MPIADRARGELLAHWLTLDTHERTMLLRLLCLPTPLRHKVLAHDDAICDLLKQGRRAYSGEGDIAAHSIVSRPRGTS